MNHYTHFSIEERENTRVFLEKGESFRSIAKLLGRSPSTICRELARNKYVNGSYAAFYAQKLANKRKLNAGIKPILSNETLKREIIFKLSKGWSAEQIWVE